MSPFIKQVNNRHSFCNIICFGRCTPLDIANMLEEALHDNPGMSPNEVSVAIFVSGPYDGKIGLQFSVEPDTELQDQYDIVPNEQLPKVYLPKVYLP